MTSDLTTRGTPRRRFPKAVRREQLTDVAERLFVERGYSGVTMEDICLEAGVSRPVLYDHFSTREWAYLSCVKRARRDYDAQVIASFDPDLGAKEQLRRGAEVFFGLLESNPGRWKLIFGSAAALPEIYASELAELRFGTIRTIEEVIDSVLPDVPSLTATFAAHAISGIGERLGLLWLKDPNIEKQDLIENYVDILWSGLSPLVPLK